MRWNNEEKLMINAFYVDDLNLAGNEKDRTKWMNQSSVDGSGWSKFVEQNTD